MVQIGAWNTSSVAWNLIYLILLSVHYYNFMPSDKIMHILWFNSIHWSKIISKILFWPIFVHLRPISRLLYALNGTKFNLLSFFYLNGIIIIYFLMKIIHILWFNSVIIRVHWCKNMKKYICFDQFSYILVQFGGLYTP